MSSTRPPFRPAFAGVPAVAALTAGCTGTAHTTEGTSHANALCGCGG